MENPTLFKTEDYFDSINTILIFNEDSNEFKTAFNYLVNLSHGVDINNHLKESNSGTKKYF